MKTLAILLLAVGLVLGISPTAEAKKKELTYVYLAYPGVNGTAQCPHYPDHLPAPYRHGHTMYVYRCWEF